jgi:hypothetical protein
MRPDVLGHESDKNHPWPSSDGSLTYAAGIAQVVEHETRNFGARCASHRTSTNNGIPWACSSIRRAPRLHRGGSRGRTVQVHQFKGL